MFGLTEQESYNKILKLGHRGLNVLLFLKGDYPEKK